MIIYHKFNYIFVFEFKIWQVGTWCLTHICVVLISCRQTLCAITTQGGEEREAEDTATPNKLVARQRWQLKFCVLLLAGIHHSQIQSPFGYSV